MPINLITETTYTNGDRFQPCGELSSVLCLTPFSITPLLRYFLIRSINLLS